MRHETRFTGLSQATPLSREGFTLVELLVVMAIIAILMGLVIGIAGAVQSGGAEAKAKAQIADLMLEVEKYQGDKGGYPPSRGVSGTPTFSEAFFTWYEDEKYVGTQFQTTEVAESSNQRYPVDPWGNPYVYDWNSSNPLVYAIGSKGPDGRWGSDGDPNDTSSFGRGDDITNRNGAL